MFVEGSLCGRQRDYIPVHERANHARKADAIRDNVNGINEGNERCEEVGALKVKMFSLLTKMIIWAPRAAKFCGATRDQAGPIHRRPFRSLLGSVIMYLDLADADQSP